MRTRLLVILLALAPLAACAIGNPEAGEYQPVTGLENWDATIDLEGYKAGKYNLIVRGIDEAGNVSYAGPYNVFVDPASDAARGARLAPRPGVAGEHPAARGRHLRRRRRREERAGEARRPGPRRRGGRGVLGLGDERGRPHRGRAHDHRPRRGRERPRGPRRRPSASTSTRSRPTTRVTSHANGAIVSGKVALEGEVADPNGVASLAASADGGKVYEPLKLDLDKPGQKGTFRYDLDTKGIPDGALVLSFKAVDRTGSTGRTAFLLFVNNQAPGLEVLCARRRRHGEREGDRDRPGRRPHRREIARLGARRRHRHRRPHARQPVLDPRARPLGREGRDGAGHLHAREPHGQPADHEAQAEGGSGGRPARADASPRPRRAPASRGTGVRHRARARRRRGRPGRVLRGRGGPADRCRGDHGILDPAPRPRRRARTRSC